MPDNPHEQRRNDDKLMAEELYPIADRLTSDMRDVRERLAEINRSQTEINARFKMGNRLFARVMKTLYDEKTGLSRRMDNLEQTSEAMLQDTKMLQKNSARDSKRLVRIELMVAAGAAIAGVILYAVIATGVDKLFG